MAVEGGAKLEAAVLVRVDVALVVVGGEGAEEEEV